MNIVSESRSLVIKFKSEMQSKQVSTKFAAYEQVLAMAGHSSNVPA